MVEYARTRHLRDNYGLDPDLYDAMVFCQDGKCAICKRTDHRRRLDIDHDHKTGKVRGLLCEKCNKMLGQARDNRDTLMAGAEYLLRYSN